MPNMNIVVKLVGIHDCHVNICLSQIILYVCGVAEHKMYRCSPGAESGEWLMTAAVMPIGHLVNVRLVHGIE
jgi:hypothetical protein